MFMGRVLRVMVCSPSDVSAERAAIVKAIHQWTADNLVEEDVVLVPVLWEDMLPSTVEGVDGQTSINEMMTHKADIFIGVFKHRFGVEARAGSEVGTVEEIMIAMKAKKPLHLFFYNGPDVIDLNNSTQVGQLAKVHEFKNSMQKHGLYAPYLNEYELKEKVSRALNLNARTFRREHSLPAAVAPSTNVEKVIDDALPEIDSKPSVSAAAKVRPDGGLATSDEPQPKSMAAFHKKLAVRHRQETTSSTFPAAHDNSSDDLLVSGSDVVYISRTDLTDESGIPTSPPSKSTNTGIPTRPQPLGLNPSSGMKYADDTGLPIRPKRPVQGKLSLEQRERLSQKQALDRERIGKKFVDDRSDLTLRELQALNQQEQQRSNRRPIDENDNWVSMQAGDELSDLDVLKHHAPKLGRTTDDELEADRRNRELKNAESVARWNADLPLKKVDDQTYRLSSELFRHESWKAEPRRGRRGDLLGFVLTQIEPRLVENIQVSITDPDDREIPVKNSVQDGVDAGKPTQIIVNIPRSVNADVLLIRVKWDLERGKYPQEEHIRFAAGNASEENVPTSKAASKSKAIQNSSMMEDELSWRHEHRQGWEIEIEKDREGYPSGITLTNKVNRVAREITVQLVKNDGSRFATFLNQPIKVLQKGESAFIKFDPNDLNGSEVMARLDWYEEGSRHGTKADLGPMEGYKVSLIKPVVNFVHGALRVTFEGDSSKAVDNFRISVRGVNGKELDIDFDENGYSGLSVDDEMNFVVKTSSLHNYIDMTWDVDGRSFVSKQRMILR